MPIKLKNNFQKIMNKLKIFYHKQKKLVSTTALLLMISSCLIAIFLIYFDIADHRSDYCKDGYFCKFFDFYKFNYRYMVLQFLWIVFSFTVFLTPLVIALCLISIKFCKIFIPLIKFLEKR